MCSTAKKFKYSFATPDIIKVNIGDEYSIYRALEDAGTEIPWTQISKDHKSFTERLKNSTSGFPVDDAESFLKEFTEINKYSVTYLKPTDTEKWVPVYFYDNRQKKIFIRQEQKNGREFTALFFMKDPSFLRAITLNKPKDSANFPQHWPPKHFVGCEEHIDILENLWKKVCHEINSTVNEARNSKDTIDETSSNDHKKRLICGLFARPKSGKSYCFNRLLLSGLISDSDTVDFATIGPSATSNAIHKTAVTKLPIRAIYSRDELVISLKDVNNDQHNQPHEIYKNTGSTKHSLNKAHLEEIVEKVNAWNKDTHAKTAYIELLIPSPFLKSVNIELIDLPGYVATMDETGNASEHINRTIAVYLDAKPEQRPLLDAVIFLTPGRKVTETIYLDLHRSGYFSAKPIFLPKLIYLVNSLEGLEKSVDYQSEKLENNIAKAREEVKDALTYFISREENSVYGIDANCVNIIFKRAAATPFFRSPFRGFNSVSDLKNIFLEVRFHKLRCRMLDLINTKLVNQIVMEKLKLIPKTKNEMKKLGDMLKKAEKIETEYKGSWKMLEKDYEQEKYSISASQYLCNKKSKDAFDSAVPPNKRNQLYSWLREQVDGYVHLLHEFAQGEKIKLIDKIRDLNSKTYKIADDGSRSESFQLIKDYLNEAQEIMEKDVPSGFPLPSTLCDAVEYALKASDFSKLDDELLSILQETICERLTSSNRTSLISYTLALCRRNAKQKSETLKNKVIEYENLLRSLHTAYSFFKTSNGKEKEILKGKSEIEIHRHPAACKDKELENELPTNPDIASYLRVTSGLGSDREIFVEFDIDKRNIEIHHDLSDKILRGLKQAGCYHQDNVIHPIFIPTKLRGRVREGTTDVEVVPPQLYKNQLNDFPETLVIPVVDKGEAERYWKYITDVSIGVNIMLVIDDSNTNIPINIGRKRHIIKMVAERMLQLNYYWVIDDDIEQFVEFGELLYRAPCTIGRALHFTQRVLQHELSMVDYTSKLEDLFYKILPQHGTKCIPLLLKARENGIKDIIVEYPDEFRKLCEETGFTVQLENIQQERLRRVGQVALYNTNQRNSEKRNFLIKKGNFSHINRGERYQVVLFNRLAMEDIDYMSRKDFFKPYRIPDTISSIDQTQSDKKKAKAKEGYMYEDWDIVQKMKAQGRLGYLVFRYGFVNFDRHKYPSLVHKLSKHVPKNKAISRHLT